MSGKQEYRFEVVGDTMQQAMSEAIRMARKLTGLIVTRFELTFEDGDSYRREVNHELVNIMEVKSDGTTLVGEFQGFEVCVSDIERSVMHTTPTREVTAKVARQIRHGGKVHD